MGHHNGLNGPPTFDNSKIQPTHFCQLRAEMGHQDHPQPFPHKYAKGARTCGPQAITLLDTFESLVFALVP